jgi:PAS domain S-box-containing protein
MSVAGQHTMTPIRILLVEDYVPFRRAIYLLLRERPEFQVFEASDGPEALRKAEELQPDLIFFGISLPELRGIEFAKRARTLAPDAKLLFLTQESSPDAAREIFLLGALGYVRKQHVLTDLFPAIQAVLRGELYLSGGLEMHQSDTAEFKKAEEVQLHHAAILESLKRSEAALRNSENERRMAQDRLQEYERAVEGLEEMLVVIDREYRYLIANKKFLKMRNMTKEQVVGRFVHEVLNEGVFEAVVKGKLDECFQGRTVQYEMQYTYPELGERNVFVSYFPVEGTTGIDRAACILQDITERKRIEEAQRSMSRKLINAQEEERGRIARELHDDVNQRLASLVMNLGILEQRPPASAKEFVLEIISARKQLSELARDIQALSHRLHPPSLEFLGLRKASVAVCEELSSRQGVRIDLHVDNVPEKLPQDVSLCLFRVLQEALQNAIRHSHSKHFQVRLQGRANDIELVVRDSGRGFEPEETINGPGLGLTSMRERLELVNGQLSIDSKSQVGTTIIARVPWRPKRSESAPAGG